MHGIQLILQAGLSRWDKTGFEMRGGGWFLGFGLAGLLLAGCAGSKPFQESALPGALATLDADNDQCVAGLRGGAYKSFGDFGRCLLTAKYKFAETIKIRDGAILEAYSSRMGTLAGEADRGNLTAAQYVERLGQINGDFNATLATAYRLDALQRQEAAAQAQAFSAALRNAGAAMQAFNPPVVNCTSTQLGAFTNTTCR